MPALPNPELPQAAVTSTDTVAEQKSVIPISTAPVSIGTTSISPVKNDEDHLSTDEKNSKVVPPPNTSLNPLTAIVMGKSAILTRQHKQRIRIKYSNLRNSTSIKSNNILNEHNVRHLSPRKKEPITNKKIDMPSKAMAESTNENLAVKNADGEPIEGLANFADIDDIKLPDESLANLNSNASSMACPQTSSNVVRKTKKRARKIAVNKNTKLHRAFDGKEKMFACRHCGKRYRWKSTLRRHENDECGNKEPSHECPYCSYKAKQRGNLGVHVRKHHADKPKLESCRKRRTV